MMGGHIRYRRELSIAARSARWLVLVAMPAAFVAFAALTYRSGRTREWLIYGRPRWSAFVVSSDCHFRFEITRKTPYDWHGDDPAGFEHRSEPANGGGAFPDRIPGETQWFRYRGFSLVTGERWGDEHFAIFAPAWCPLILTAAMSFVIARPWLTRRRPGSGRCRRCGYDLRASVNRCPECGTTFG